MAISNIAGINLDDIPQPNQSTIAAALTELVIGQLIEELYAEMAPKDRQTLEDLTERNITQDQVLDFLKERFPDFDERIGKIAAQQKKLLEVKVKTMLEVIKTNQTT